MKAATLLIPLLPLASFIITGLLGKRYFGIKSHYLSVAAVAVSWLLSVYLIIQVERGEELHWTVYSWIAAGSFKVEIGFLVDQLTAVMLLVVSTVGFMVHVYSIGYMKGDGGYYRFFAYLNLFMFSMFMLILGNNFLMLYVFWEAVGLCSYLLISFWYTKKSAANAGTKAFLVNRVGDFGFGLGIMLIFVTLGTLSYQGVFGSVSLIGGGTLTAICLLLFMGAIGKSAQFPLHVWLPDAMEGPTPVSSLIHAATMVNAGVYMVARANPLFSQSHTAMLVVASVGAFTAIFAATIGLVQNDIKKVLAYSTISQLGYMFLALGVGAWTAGMFHLVAHGFFKGLLFLCSGSVIHSLSGEQDMRKMGGLKGKIKITYWTFVIGALAIAGFPGFAGFFSKDAVLAGVFNEGYWYFWILAMITVFMTAFYMFRLIFMTFHGENRSVKEVYEHVHESPRSMTVPLIILAVPSVLIGLILGIPPESGHIDHFLHEIFYAAIPAPEHAFSLESLGLMIGSAVVGLAGIYTAYHMYVVDTALPRKIGNRFQPIYRLFLNKYWVDEIYFALFINPVRALGRGLWRWVDAGMIDGFANGSARFFRGVGVVIRPAQSGKVQAYLFSMFLGLLALLAAYLVLTL
ncbi:MAG: NADH-quinone oxidoreductase subunit L [Actinobacteria bacterium]|nr:NADH-quinone oxidoreductase subunit L [Actinomycetota bacterium]